MEIPVKFNTGFQAKQTQSQMRLVDQSICYFKEAVPIQKGQLMVVGGGIRAISDMTLDAEAQIRAACRKKEEKEMHKCLQM